MLQSFLLAIGLVAAPAAVAREVVELIPEQVASVSATHIFAPITGFFMGGHGYWYSAREIEIDTVPPGATLDLFYVRASFQKGYEQAEAPIKLVLPSRVEADKRDSVTIRALLDGYQQKEVRVPVRSRQEKVVIELEPLANQLIAVTQRYFAGRASLAFLTREALTFRVQQRDDGFSVILTGTAETDAARGTIEGASSPLVSSLQARQIGQDLLVRAVLADAARGTTVRSRQDFDAVRDVHTFALDLVPADGGAQAVQRAKAALGRIAPRDVAGCGLAYDAALREQLEPAALTRALAPDGSFTDPYLREAMKRLGELSPNGRLTLTDGSTFLAAAPIELMAASSRAAEVVGYLVMLRAFVAELERPDDLRPTLRGLLAPELAVERFDGIAAAADEREAACLAGGAPGGPKQL
jgi:hypothetical protein